MEKECQGVGVSKVRQREGVSERRCVGERVCQKDSECDRKSLGIGTHGTWLQSSLLTYVL